MTTKRAVNLSIDAELLAEAKKSGANLSQTLEAALRARLSDDRRRRWLEDNRDAIKASNAELARNGHWHMPDWLPE